MRAQAVQQGETYRKLYEGEAKMRAAAEARANREVMAARERVEVAEEELARLGKELVYVQRNPPGLKQSIDRKWTGLK